MAYCREQYCNPCGRETPHTNHDCDVCMDKEYDQKQAEWKALTVEEKLLNIHERLKFLENRGHW